MSNKTTAHRARLTCGQINVIGGLLCVSITAAAAYIVIEPINRKVREQRTFEMGLAAQHTTTAQVLRTYDALATTLEDDRNALSASQLQLQPVGGLNRRLADITALLENAGLTIQQTVIGDPVSQERYQTIPIKLSGRGEYPNCARFLHAVHESLPDTGVTSVGMSSNPRSPGQAADFAFDLVWYAAPVTTASAE